jgi:cob(I)alamin adenosyltransferase
MVKLNKIYTRTGDDGSTGLVDGSGRSKADMRMHAIGSVDEANSAIGLAISMMSEGADAEALRDVQNDLFDLGADIATPAGDGDDFAPSQMVLRIVPTQVAWIEDAIDNANEALAPLNSFILPGGSAGASALHVARATVRRAERDLVAVSANEAINPQALAYINRLSDYLFVLCRKVNDNGAGDILWVPGASR